MVIINNDSALDPIIACILLGSSIAILIYSICLIISVIRKGE